MITDSQAKWIFKIHVFCMKLQNRHKILAALGGVGIQTLMGFCYASVLQQGAKANADEKMSRL